MNWTGATSPACPGRNGRSCGIKKLGSFFKTSTCSRACRRWKTSRCRWPMPVVVSPTRTVAPVRGPYRRGWVWETGSITNPRVCRVVSNSEWRSRGRWSTNLKVVIADEPTGNLDSRTGQEVLAMFRKLNSEDGITVILVTHDESVAQSADRTIRIRDGLIEAAEPSVPETPRAMSRLKMTVPEEPTAAERWGEARPVVQRRRALLLDYVRTTRTAVRCMPSAMS